MFKPTLPEKENNTYFILPKAGEPPQAGAKPDARDMVAAINPAYLEFSKTRRTSFRPMNILLSIWGAGGLGFLAMFPMVVLAWIDKDTKGLDVPIVGTLILAISLWIAIGVPLRQLRRPHSPILLSKRLRRFYQWQGKQKGWTALDYDQVVPFVTRLTVVSTAGTSTSFFLDVGVFEPGTRIRGTATGF
ncbi:hypothetical protein C7E18_12540 [Stenotrophomonas maltophilia]|nr:hypothetical protein C7E18_12540 [Stenotrophomonas maltophilia]